METVFLSQWVETFPLPIGGLHNGQGYRCRLTNSPRGQAKDDATNCCQAPLRGHLQEGRACAVDALSMELAFQLVSQRLSSGVSHRLALQTKLPRHVEPS